tara:strand:+ start:471 stop:761 length:291 start_codon:yes stop_codon:yes gene_type:complete
MTKRFHKCDETCKHPEEKPKVKKVKTVSPAKIAKEIKVTMKPEVVNVYTDKPNPAKIKIIWEIIDVVDKIGNPLETNKVLEKTLITLRKLQQDIAN